MASCDSFCSLLRGCASVTLPNTLVSLGTSTSPVEVFMSCVTLATTSSPVLAFLASTVLVSCTGITLPGAIFFAPAGCDWVPPGCGEVAGWEVCGACVGAGVGACEVCGTGCAAGGCAAPGSAGEGVVFCASATAHSIAPVNATAKKFFIEALLAKFSERARNR